MVKNASRFKLQLTFTKRIISSTGIADGFVCISYGILSSKEAFKCFRMLLIDSLPDNKHLTITMNNEYRSFAQFLLLDLASIRAIGVNPLTLKNKEDMDISELILKFFYYYSTLLQIHTIYIRCIQFRCRAQIVCSSV